MESLGPNDLNTCWTKSAFVTPIYVDIYIYIHINIYIFLLPHIYIYCQFPQCFRTECLSSVIVYNFIRQTWFYQNAVGALSFAWMITWVSLEIARHAENICMHLNCGHRWITVLRQWTQWDADNTNAIMQTTFPYSFSVTKMVVFWFEFHGLGSKGSINEIIIIEPEDGLGQTCNKSLWN